MSAFMQPIYTQTVGAGGATSITFNNIPQGYTDLKLVMSVRTTNASSQWDSAAIVFNGDTSFRYFSTLMFGNGATAGGNRDAGARGGLYATNLTQANTFGNIEMNIFKYSSGLLKTFSTSSTQGNNTTTSLPTLGANVWASTAPITSITLSSTTGATFLQHSSFTLYGTGVQFAGGLPTAPTLNSVTDEAGFVQVAFTPAANDQASSYAVTSIPGGVTTYGASSPIDTPAALNTSYVYRVSAVNDRGTSASSNSASITTFNSFASIATQAVGAGGAASVTFNNIPQNYSHLELHIFAKDGSGGVFSNTSIRINGGNGEWRHDAFGSGTTPGSSNDPTSFIAYIGGTAQFGSAIVEILEYTSTVKAKTLRGFSALDTNGNGLSTILSGIETSLAPVTSLVLTPATGNFAQFSHFALYGIA